MSNIGELNEKSLHAQLKAWYSREGDEIEIKLGRYVIDIVRGDQLIEIQSRNFSSIKHKLESLVEDHPVRLVYPIAAEKWISKIPGGDERRSPKRGKLLDIFQELVYIPGLVNNKNFELEVLLIHEREIRQKSDKRRWRKKGWETVERQLIKVTDSRKFCFPGDLVDLLPHDIPDEFTTKDLSSVRGISKRLAGQIAYSLREMGAIKQIGKRKKAFLYKVSDFIK